MKKTFFYCLYDSWGQRNGHYKSIELHDNEIEVWSDGSLYWNDRFLYKDEMECIRACQD